MPGITASRIREGINSGELRVSGNDLIPTDGRSFNEWASSASGSDGLGRYGYTEDGLAFLRGNSDSEINAINQQSLWNREDLLRKVAEHREDYSMDRIVAAAKRNGINPVFLLDSLSSNTVGNAASYTTSAAKANNYDTNAKTDQATSAKIVGALVAALALIIAAA